MARGVLYVRSLYPGDIDVQEKKFFEMAVDGSLGVILVNRHIVALSINDFRNGIEIVNEGERRVPKLKVQITTIDQNLSLFDGSPDRLLCLLDYTRLDYRHGRAFSEILIAFEIAETETIGDKELEFHNAVLEKFIRLYRHVSRDVSILMPDRLLRDKPISMVSAIPYSKEELQISVKERLRQPRALQFGVKRLDFTEFAKYLPKTNPEPEANTLAIEARLSTGLPCDESYDGLLRAFEELAVNENPKWALLDAFMVLELAAARFINEAKIAKGVSKKKLEEFHRDIGISYMLNVDLPLFLFPLSEKERQTIQEADAVRRTRNKVVHAGGVVSKEEALHAINAASNLLDLLKSRPASPETNSASGGL